MATLISPLSYLDTTPYQSPVASLSASSATAAAATAATAAGAAAGVSATSELQAMQKQGDLLSFLKNSLAAALLQPADGATSGASANTLIDNMLQQVLGAYQTQSASASAGGTSATG
jgi:hypothetical protein